MRKPSVADALGAAQREEVARLAPADRIRLALELGRESLELMRRRDGLSLEEARRAQERRRQSQRRRSKCLEALLA